MLIGYEKQTSENCNSCFRLEPQSKNQMSPKIFLAVQLFKNPKPILLSRRRKVVRTVHIEVHMTIITFSDPSSLKFHDISAGDILLTTIGWRQLACAQLVILHFAKEHKINLNN
ncbi:hypothetical protein RF11_05973 [Thelohanellus kitauei]|uniref:Uncharacterized protein n=1 Tax=Thelohanellus kitauei TaxID=669202 RepID=A0A0C2MCW8_THEKT|nr:hypothetical protein RF11_05973 [Thelohanellus kitauei]